jgi:hypothetical protein
VWCPVLWWICSGVTKLTWRGRSLDLELSSIYELENGNENGNVLQKYWNNGNSDGNGRLWPPNPVSLTYTYGSTWSIRTGFGLLSRPESSSFPVCNPVFLSSSEGWFLIGRLLYITSESSRVKDAEGLLTIPWWISTSESRAGWFIHSRASLDTVWWGPSIRKMTEGWQRRALFPGHWHYMTT